MKSYPLFWKMMAFAVSLGTLSSLARADDPYGKHTEWVTNAWYAVQVYDVPYDNFLISGTNVKFRVEATCHAFDVPDGGGGTTSDPATEIWITDVKVKIQGTEIANPKPIDNHSQKHFFDAVFASTHFAHDTQLEVKGTATFHVVYQSGAQSNQTVEVIVKPRTYNKGVLLATSIDNGGGEAATALACVNAVGPIIEAMCHVVLPKPWAGAQSLDEAALDPLLRESTVFFACTHGEPGAFWDSANIKKYDKVKVHSVLIQKATNNIPVCNLVFIAGCQTALDTRGDEFAAEFGMHLLSVDKAYVGFKATLLTPGLEDYVREVFSLLKQGYTIKRSVEDAFSKIRPQTNGVLWGTSTLKPVILGDAQMKLVNVYGGESWYRAF